jgi:D-threo-aldose 1-dehydrogenase
MNILFDPDQKQSFICYFYFPKMNKKMNMLGRTGIEVPPVIYGTSYLGNLYRKLPWQSKLAIMKEWFRHTPGTVVIDSAGKYGAGLALESIGKGLKELGVDPENIVISNKLGWYRVPLTTQEPTFEKGVWAGIRHDAVQKISYNGIMECYEQGNELLGEYKAGLVSVHDPDEYLATAENEKERAAKLSDITEAYRALFELKDRGEVKAVGIGSKDWKVIRELYGMIRFDWVMFANSFTIYRHPKEIVKFIEDLAADGVGVINSAIFNAGFLTGGDYFDYRLVDPSNLQDKELFQWRDRFFSVCEMFHVQPGDACLHFAVSMPQISAVALNPGKPERIKRNFEVLNTPLPEDFWKALKKEGIIDKDYQYL